jgi:hypothetical protein
MLFIKALTFDKSEVEYFNLSNVLSIKELPNGSTKILMGAGLYWQVWTDTIEFVDTTKIEF